MPDTISIDQVTKEYGTAVKTQALRGVSFRVAEKEFLSIIGQSGSGKSTLLNLLGLLDRPTEGTVNLLGTDVGKLGKKERAAFRNEHLGFVFQFHHLLPEFSVRENLLLPTWIGAPASDDQGRGQRPQTSRRDPLLPGTGWSRRQERRTALGRAEAAGGHRDGR